MKKILILIITALIIFSGCAQEEIKFQKEKEIVQIGQYEKPNETNLNKDKNQIIKDFKEQNELENIDNTYIKIDNKTIELKNRDENKEKGKETINPNFTPKTWGFQLQRNNFNEIKNYDVDLIVIDIDEASFTKSQIIDLKQDKYIISYLSIGEAEDYRNYWEEDWSLGNPTFLDEENQDWPGNYKVKFWEDDWQEIVIRQLDKIIDAGYDGAYFDIVDAYWYYQEKGRTTSEKEMIDFIIKLSNHAKNKNPNFIIIPQNALDLVNNQNYLEAIDAIGKEDTWYIDDEKVGTEELNYYLQFMRKVRGEGKPVFVIDYPTKQNLKEDFIEKAKNEGFIPFAANRALDSLE